MLILKRRGNIGMHCSYYPLEGNNNIRARIVDRAGRTRVLLALLTLLFFSMIILFCWLPPKDPTTLIIGEAVPVCSCDKACIVE